MITNLTVGGHQGLLVDQVERLRAERFSAYVAYVNDGPLRQRLERRGVRMFVYSTPAMQQALSERHLIRFIPSYLSALARVLGYIRRNGIDLLVTSDALSFVVGTTSARMAQIPSVRRPGTLMRTSERLLLRAFRGLPFGYWTDAYISGMRVILDEYRSVGVPERKLYLVPAGVDVDRFRPGLSGDDFRKELGLASDALLVGIVSRIDYDDRGIDILIRSMLQVCTHFPQSRCIIIGDGPRLGEFKQLAIDLGLNETVIFTGLRTDTMRIIPALDVAAFPVVGNVGGLFMLEAMACGKPVITTLTEGGAQREWVDDGVNGFLIPEKDPEALAQRINLLFAQPSLARKLGAAARQSIETKHSIAQSHDLVEDLYLRLIASN